MGWQVVGGVAKVSMCAMVFLRSPENVGGVAGHRWGDKV